MNFKKKTHKKTTWRKEVHPTASLSEWSRMLHLWWKRDVADKRIFRKAK